ncbi:hypothetical protein COO91_10440 (plasmid) [Nostoc flagelliforme CCNUN1]|uniref:Uncharacterized protein n=1 Tax=Nostoc flagelliforme CCNUN1 TaxID=2038116 RepID=A0A2K8T934_9NOSO|nr:hypothetical protein COO91_10440 [Nostoc flagelliforme CCNUN1]
MKFIFLWQTGLKLLLHLSFRGFRHPLSLIPLVTHGCPNNS